LPTERPGGLRPCPGGDPAARARDARSLLHAVSQVDRVVSLLGLFRPQPGRHVLAAARRTTSRPEKRYLERHAAALAGPGPN